MAARSRRLLPAAVYRLVEETRGAVLLEGGPQATNNSHTSSSKNEEPWTRLFTAPSRVCAAYSAAEVHELFAQIERAVAAGESAAGFFSYECGACFEPKAGMHLPRAGLPLAWFGFYQRPYVFDHERGEFIGGGPPELESLEKGGAAATAAAFAPEGFVEAEFALDPPEYARRIEAIHEWIRAGDVYQLNFTAPLRLRGGEDAARWYAHLRARQPAGYGAFLHWEQGRRILSFSPELFFRVEHDGEARRIVTRPMKGTARRGRSTQEDRAAAAWLRSDAKNRSENLMIVDLLRNDLGRLARFGTVRAENLFAVERLPTLWQMTSTVTAELRDEVGFEQVFRALFPCGSVTGAPKVRAMQLIGKIEDGPRGVYTGAIGFFAPRQTIFNVAIRTIEMNNGNATMGVGSGIVIDSDAAAEYRECLLKAEFLTQPVGDQPEEFCLIETMLWESGYPLLELHLDRLAESAEYFDFECERAEVKAELERRAQRFCEGAARRVRLLLARDGGMQISDQVLTQEPAEEGAGSRVCMARERTNSSDPMLFHKTTHRRLYARAFASAQSGGFADVLFMNEREELTEGAISNVFVVKNGRWRTPPIECGLLPGVYRRHLLETRPEIEERVLGEEDLRNADAVYIANAVRGLRRVAVEWPGSKDSSQLA